MESGAAIRISNNRADGRVPYKMGGDVAGEPISVIITGVPTAGRDD